MCLQEFTARQKFLCKRLQEFTRFVLRLCTFAANSMNNFFVLKAV